MRKRKKGRKLSRERNQRKALIKSLAANLIFREKIITSQAKAKELSSFIDKKITKAKENTIQSRRLLAKFFDERTVKKLTDKIAPRYKDRKGGYTKIIKLGRRKPDGAKTAIIELVK